MNEPHAPVASAKLPDLSLQLAVEKTVCLWAADDLEERDWAAELAQSDDPRSTVHRFAILRDDPRRMALVVMLHGLRQRPEAWTCGVEAALAQWPDARRAVRDVLRMRAAPSGGDVVWTP
jgi:hypothetical protein